ncbi:MAG: lycopene cyclase family protein [Flavobacteriales bacterium]
MDSLNNRYDYIIIGAGASGLQMAEALTERAGFRILLIDGETAETPERTWCFWAEPHSLYAGWAHKTWSEVEFKGPSLVQITPLDEVHYVMLQSRDFRRRMLERFQGKVDVVSGRVNAMNEGEEVVEVVLETGERFFGSQVFSSVWRREDVAHAHEEPWIEQHFIGWFVETDEEVFDEQRFVMMDFSSERHGRTGFMYVLPLSGRSALLEYTVFSKDILNDEAYEQEIRDYLVGLNVGSYRITGKERGSIPMTTYPFHHRNTARIHYIGTAGGWTKASTGYTFQQSAKQARQMLECLATDPHSSYTPSRWRSRFFDRVMLDLLSHRNDAGAVFFESLYRHHSLDRILRFLAEQTSWWEDVIIILRSKPRALLIQSVWRVLFSAEYK